MNIYEKIASIMGDIQYLAKDDKVEFNKTSYLPARSSKQIDSRPSAPPGKTCTIGCRRKWRSLRPVW